MRWLVLACLLTACQSPEPKLSTTEQLAVVVGPPAFDFGPIEVSTSSTPTTFVVSPAGSGPTDQTITQIIGCSGFVIDAPGVPGAEVFRHCAGIEPGTPDTQSATEAACSGAMVRTYSFTAKFAPTVQGDANCVGQIVMNNGVQLFTMAGKGIPPKKRILVAPRNINFSGIRVGETSNLRSVEITNDGAETLQLNVAFDTVEQIKMVDGKLGKQMLEKGAVAKLDFNCAPDAIGDFAARLTVTSDDPANPQIVIPMACQGIMSNLAIAPTSFDVTTLVDKPIPATIDLVNEGNVAGTILSIAFAPGTNPDVAFVDKPANGTSLPGNGGTEQIEIEYAPSAAVENGELGSVVIRFEGDADRIVPISGGAKLATIGANPGLLDFGPVCAGSTSTQQVQILAAGNAPINVTSVTTAAPFGVVQLADAVPLQAGGAVRLTLDVSISPAPPTEEDQTVSGALVVTSDSPTTPTFEVPLSAQPLDEGVTATKELSLGAIEVGSRSDAQAVQITNCEAQAITLMEPRFLGANAGDFDLIRAFPTTVVEPGDTVAIDVVFEPSAPGQRTAEMEIDFSGSRATVALVGDGLGELDGRDTYYACSTGGDAAWPIGVVVIVIARRRRRR